MYICIVMERFRLGIWYLTPVLYQGTVHSFHKVNIHVSSARKKNTHSKPCASMGIITRTIINRRIMVSTSWSKRKGSDISLILHSRINNQSSESSCMVEMKTGSKNTTPAKLRSEKKLCIDRLMSYPCIIITYTFFGVECDQV